MDQEGKESKVRGEDFADYPDLLRKDYLLPAPDFFVVFDQEVSELGEPYAALTANFKQNMQAAWKVGALPITLIHGQLLVRFVTDFVGPIKFGPEADMAAVPEKFLKGFEAAYEDEPRTMRKMAVTAALAASASVPETRSASDELLLHTHVHAWGAFEALFSDGVRALLNHRPSLGVEILTSDGLKKYLPAKIISIEGIAARGFDVSGKLGDMILEERPLDSLTVMRAIGDVLFKDEADVTRRLNDPALWNAWQRRHLIVHKRAVVDSAFLKKTGEKLDLGSRLKLTGSDLEQTLALIRDVGAVFVCALGRVSKKDA